MMAFAVGLTRSWVLAYTAGLASDARDERRAEIESDLWEHGALNGSNGTTAMEVVVRLLFGVPADLTWRMQQTGRKGAMVATLRNNWLGLLVAGFAGAAIVFGTAIFVKFVGDDTKGTLGALIYGVGGFAAALVMLIGFYVSEREPMRGVVMLAVGTLAITAIYFWMFFIYVPVALVVIAFGILRARKFARGRDRLGPA